MPKLSYNLAVILPLSLLVLGGCTAQYKAIARHTDNPKTGLMIGDVVHNMATGGGTMRMQEYGKDTVCEGAAGIKGMGFDGTLEMTCTDGRTVTGEWQATGLTSGTGTAVDSKGKQYSFAFGLTDAQVQDYIQQQADGKPQKGKPHHVQ